MRVRDLVTDILQDLNVVGTGETPSNEEADVVLRRLNRWINSLALDGLVCLTVLRTTKTLAAGTPSYTIGTGGDIDIVRPDHIDRARLIIDTAADPLSEIPLDIFTDQRWQNITQKTLTGAMPSGIFFDRAWTAGLGRIYPWPIPNVGTTQLVLYTLQALTEFASINAELTLAPGYEEYLYTNGLLRVAPAFRRVVTQEQREAARDAALKLKTSNVRPVEIGVDDALLDRPGSGTWDQTTGEFR